MDVKELNYYYTKFKFGEDNFHNLMKHRVREILLVSTFYDAFIFEQDGRLSEQIFGEYMQLNLSTAPRITSVPTGEQALDLLKDKKYDLVITMMRIGEMSPYKLSRKIKEMHPEIPVLLLLNVSSDVGMIDKRSDEMKYIDNVFVWYGDSKIFLSMVKYIEDKWNVENDTKVGLVRVILLVEDSIHYYSVFHPLLYSEILKQTQRLITEELNDVNKRLRMRGRPKVLLCHSFDEALEIYEKYKEYIITIISDIRYDYKGKEHPKAGVKLIKHLQYHQAGCPILLQSSEMQNEKDAKQLGVSFLHKNSKTLLNDLRKFIIEKLGFGDFVFRSKDGKEIARARTLAEFEELLKVIPDESLEWHGMHNSFSAWLTAHGEFIFAKRVRTFKVEDFESTSEMRDYLINVFKEVRLTKNRGKIIHYDPLFLSAEEVVIQMREGSLGGKGRGLAFLNSLLVSMEFEKRFADVKIKIPKTFIIGTSEYDYFIDNLNIGEWIRDKSDEYIKEIFLHGSLSPGLMNMLSNFLEKIDYPLAVRSSGLLEDSQSQPFAGIYLTYMLPNNHPDMMKRAEQLMNAIKLVFASVYLENAKNYIESINYKLEEEKMAVIIQEAVGANFSGFFYPHISGVAQSYNYYPTSYLKNSDGICTLALGLGMAVVEGESIFRFCPVYPKMEIVPPEELMRESQKMFYAIDTTNPEFELQESSTLKKLKLKDAENHGTINHLVSVWDYENNRIVDGLHGKSPRLLTFADVLKYNYFPLAKIIREILEIGENAMGVPVELEFAVDLNKDPQNKQYPTFYLLQIRPLTINTEEIYIDSEDINKDELFLYTQSGMGNGVISDIHDIVFVDPDKFDRIKTEEIKREVAYFNEKMKEDNVPYILIGPGRWGSRDKFLGIPVKWHEINKAKIIVETGLEGFSVESSQGTHFFHNLISMNVGYFTVPYDSEHDFINWQWLKKQTVTERTEHCIHLELDHAAMVKMDGRKGISFIYK